MIDGTVNPRAAQRDWKRFSIRIGGSLTVLGLLFFFLPREQLLTALSGFSIEIWLTAVSIYLCLHLIGVAKWRLLLNTAGADLDFSQVARCYYYGLFGNTFLPSVVGGDILRTGLAMRLSSSRAAVLTGSVVDRAIDSIGLAAVAGLGALLVPMSLDGYSRNVFVAGAVFVAAGCITMALLLYAFPAQRVSSRVRRIILKARHAAGSLIRKPGTLLLALLSVVVLQTLQVVMNLWLGRLALITSATFVMWLFVWPLAKLAAMVPLTQGGIGVREAAQGALFLPFGVSMEKAVAAGLIFQAIVLSGNLAGGFIAFLLGRAASLQPAAAVQAAHRRGVRFALVAGGVLFFAANTLALARLTGSAGPEWYDWMNLLPGYGASFAGGCLGFLYGAIPGYLAGRLVNYASRS